MKGNETADPNLPVESFIIRRISPQGPLNGERKRTVLSGRCDTNANETVIPGFPVYLCVFIWRCLNYQLCTPAAFRFVRFSNFFYCFVFADVTSGFACAQKTELGFIFCVPVFVLGFWILKVIFYDNLHYFECEVSR